VRFHLVDRITAWHPGSRAAGLKAVARTDADQLPRTLLIESLAQLSSFLLGDSEARDGRKVLSLMTSVDRLKWHADLHPGQRARLETQILGRRPEGAKCAVTAHVDDRLIAEGQLGFVFFAAESEAQVKDFAWTYELLLALSAGCTEGTPPRREVFA
jgi:3-hydroxyacyl-[acyl-carrier-protein] dehydratase